MKKDEKRRKKTKLDELINMLARLTQSGKHICVEPVFVAIEGGSAAGKTTLAAELQEKFDCNVFHMDDFFLQPFQRTEQRLNEIGGNVDYERFAEEVLKPLKAGQPFSYRPYDCKKQALGEPIHVTPKQLNIIEGAYSMHPYFGDCYDVKIFMKVGRASQILRIMARNPQMYEKFINEWIPKENVYFEAFAVREKCDYIIPLPGGVPEGRGGYN